MTLWADVDSEVEARQALLDLLDALVYEDGTRMPAPCTESPDEWFPGKGDRAEYQKLVCYRLCPARVQCRVYAMIAGEKIGVWGGENAPGSRRIQERRRQRAAGR